MLNYWRVPFKLNFWCSDLWVGPNDCHGGHREAEAKGRSEVKICIPTASWPAARLHPRQPAHKNLRGFRLIFIPLLLVLRWISRELEWFSPQVPKDLIGAKQFSHQPLGDKVRARSRGKRRPRTPMRLITSQPSPQLRWPDPMHTPSFHWKKLAEHSGQWQI